MTTRSQYSTEESHVSLSTVCLHHLALFCTAYYPNPLPSLVLAAAEHDALAATTSAVVPTPPFMISLLERAIISNALMHNA